MINLFEPYISEVESNVTSKVIQSKFWASGSGINYVKKFEDEFMKYTNSKGCIAVNSGTAALHLALSLFNIENKEILVPSLTFVSTINAILYNKAKPVFVDVEPKNLSMDINEIQKKISKKTGGIIIVDFGGMPTNFKEIKKIANKNKIPVIEDAAHSRGATNDGKMVGAHFDAVCFSFHPVKNLAMPTGGAICLNTNMIKTSEKILKSLRWCGIENRNGYNYDIGRLGWNYYMNEISAAIGLTQLKKLDKANQKRRDIAKKYFSELKIKDKMNFSNDCVYHFYWIRVKNRNEFMKKMRENGIETGIHYQPVHQMSFYRNKIKLPITEQIGKEIVSIPTHPNLTNLQIQKIIRVINELQT